MELWATLKGGEVPDFECPMAMILYHAAGCEGPMACFEDEPASK